jgi:aminoglycoside phosphotransferase (APT) family kinase protein
MRPEEISDGIGHPGEPQPTRITHHASRITRNFVPFTLEEAPAYLAAAGLIEPGEPLGLTELGGGVSSIVVQAETPSRRLIVKQALPKLKVRADWPSRPDRSAVEVAALRAYGPHLPAGAVPAVLHADPARHLFVMTAAPAGALNWKTKLLAGRVDPAVATRAGAILAGMHLGTAADPATAARFDDREFFHTLRVDPYYWEVCRVHPDLRPAIAPLIDEMLAHRQALVHGDYSPKNMLVHGDELLILDFEVAHWGDPAFDLAFCLNHFLLKAVYKTPDAAPYFELARRFWAAYAPALALEPAATLLPRALALQAGMMLARIDGKSPAEYITEPAMRERVRRMGRRLLAARPAALDETIAIVAGTPA